MPTFYSIHDYYISHHGIKGQKWGMRRFQNPDGTLTEEGKKRYAKMSKRELKRSEELQKLGMSKFEADTEAIKSTIFKKRVVAGASAVAAASAIAYAIKKHGDVSVDRILKKGTKIQTVSSDENRMKKGTAFYTAYKDKDAKRYEAFFGKQNGVNKFSISRYAKTDAKIASPKNAEEVFDNLLKNKKFKSKLDATAGLREKYEEAKKLGGGKESKTLYDSFNRWNLIENDKDSRYLQKSFYKALKKKGYSGVVDTNDLSYTWAKTDPVIIFDKHAFGKQNAQRLTNSRIRRSKVTAVRDYTKDVLNTPVANIAGLGALSYGVIKIREKHVEKKAKKISDKSK